MLLVAVACGKNENAVREPGSKPEPSGPEPPVEVATDFTACLAEQISGTDSTFSWKAGEELAIIWAEGTDAYTITEAKNTVEFFSDASKSSFCFAAYPASAARELYGNSLMMSIPAVQGGTFREACIWFAKAEPESRVFELRNITALGRITLGRSDIKKISICANGGECLAGTVYVSAGADGTPSCAEADAAEITLVPSGAGAFAPGSYYFAAAPGTLSGGISFTLETSGGDIMMGKAYPDHNTLERASVLDFGTIDVFSAADALRLRFTFGPENGTKPAASEAGIISNWPDAADASVLDGITCIYILDGTAYSFYAKDLVGSKGAGQFYWATGNEKYGDRIAIPSATTYFGLPAIPGYKLVEVIAGQMRRGATDKNEGATTDIGITTCIPADAESAKEYVTGGEPVTWPGGIDLLSIVDHGYSLKGTEENTMYYLSSNTPAVGLYLGRLVLGYEKPGSAYKGFPEWSGEERESAYDNADIRILFIGNSFTRDAVYHLPGIIKAAGIDKKILLTHMYYGGRTAQNYYKNWNKNRDFTCYQALPGAADWVTDKTGSGCTLAEMAAATDWDVITIQEHTGNQTSWYWTDDEKTALQGLIDYARGAKTDNTPQVHYVMSQAYLNLEKAGSNQCFNSEAEMYSVITTQARKVMAETDFDGIISTGTMLQNLRTSSLNDELHLTRDGFHMNLGISRYGAACTVFESIITPLTGKNLDGNGYRFQGEEDGITIPVTDDNAPIALQAARAAIQNPFEVTNMNNQ